MIKKIIYVVAGLMAFHSCKIENDIPYPIVAGNITAFEVEGQRAGQNGGSSEATISTQNRTVTLYVDDSVDLTNLRITRLAVSNEAEVIPDSTVCNNYNRFPREGFSSLDDMPLSTDTRMDFTNPVTFTLRTYQDYVWTVNVTQLIDREILLANQTGLVLDVENHRVVVYVSPEQPLDAIPVSVFNLGGEHGTVYPDPTAYDTFDFSSPVTFYVHRAWDAEGITTAWTVYVYQQEGSEDTGDVFARVTSASLSGSIQNGKTPVVEYKRQGASGWTSLSSSAVTVRGTSYSAEFTGLSAGTTYQYRVSIDGVAGAEQAFTTAPATPLPNGSLEEWSTTGSGKQIQYNPWADGDESFWGTGNAGAAPFIGSITIPDTEERVAGTAVRLESRWAAIKLAAGNLFTGDFALDGTQGLLHFGREFSSFPTALRFYYKYTSSNINRIGSEVGDLENLRNRPDSCHVYIALSDKSEPYVIRTRPSVRQVFDKNDANVIAYGEFISAETTTSYQQVTIPLEYRSQMRKPRYIIIVCSSSKYGDYFIGGDASTLWLDEMELVYE